MLDSRTHTWLPLKKIRHTQWFIKSNSLETKSNKREETIYHKLVSLSRRQAVFPEIINTICRMFLSHTSRATFRSFDYFHLFTPHLLKNLIDSGNTKAPWFLSIQTWHNLQFHNQILFSAVFPNSPIQRGYFCTSRFKPTNTNTSVIYRPHGLSGPH